MEHYAAAYEAADVQKELDRANASHGSSRDGSGDDDDEAEVRVRGR